MSRSITKSLNLRDALSLVRELGGTVAQVDGKGEFIIRFPGEDISLRVNQRRKDTPRKLITLLRRAEARRAA